MPRLPRPPVLFNKRSHYDVLGVTKTASKIDIRKAYLKRSKELHPDSGGRSADVDAFVALNEAYSVLGSVEKRRVYDGGNNNVNEMPLFYRGRPMTFEERCQRFGFPPQDVEFYTEERKKRARISALFCIALVIVGSIMSSLLVLTGPKLVQRFFPHRKTEQKIVYCDDPIKVLGALNRQNNK